MDTLPESVYAQSLPYIQVVGNIKMAEGTIIAGNTKNRTSLVSIRYTHNDEPHCK